MRSFKRRCVAYSGRVENHDVGFHAWPQKATIEQSKTLRRKRCHLPHCVFNRENIPLTYIHGKNARERAVAPGMRSILPQNRNLPVRADHRGWMPENPLQVLLIDCMKYPRTASLLRNP